MKCIGIRFIRAHRSRLSRCRPFRNRTKGVLGVHIATASVGTTYDEIMASGRASDQPGDFRQGLSAQTAKVDNILSFHGASIAFNATATADYGQLKVGTVTLWNLVDDNPQEGFYAHNDANASARWIDVANVDVPGRVSGFLDVQSFLFVSGTMEGAASQTGNPENNNAEGHLRLDLSSGNPAITIQGGFSMGRLTASAPDTANLKILPPERIPVRFLYEIGKPFSIDLTLSLHSDGTSLSGFADKTNVFMETQADYTHTLSWGGITQVTDHQTGQVINNWTISSESGFDYSQPFPVPEPTTATLLLLGMLGAGVGTAAK